MFLVFEALAIIDRESPRIIINFEIKQIPIGPVLVIEPNTSHSNPSARQKLYKKDGKLITTVLR